MLRLLMSLHFKKNPNQILHNQSYVYQMDGLAGLKTLFTIMDLSQKI